MEFSYFNYIVLPLLIFFSRVLDVSLGTIRMVFISKGFERAAPILGFFEVLIWIVAVKQVMDNLTSPTLYLAYAAGFAFGTYIGMKFENKLSVGKVLVRIFLHGNNADVVSELRKDYKLTVSNAYGRDGDVKIVFAIINRKKLRSFLKKLNEYCPRAFYSIEDVRYANDIITDEVKEKRKILEIFRKKK